MRVNRTATGPLGPDGATAPRAKRVASRVHARGAQAIDGVNARRLREMKREGELRTAPLYQPRACSMTRTLASPSWAVTASGVPRAMARVMLSTWAL